jgi:tRNA(Ile)-lysidine synthase
MKGMMYRQSRLKDFRKRNALTYQLDSDRYGVACSGGADSVMAVTILAERLKKHITIVHFNHGTEYCDAAENFVKSKYESKFDVVYGELTGRRSSEDSKQSFWRKERMKFLLDWSLANNCQVVLGHNLTDVMETWLKSSIDGRPALIPSSFGPYNNLIRPFLTASREDIRSLLKDIEEEYFDCPSNLDFSYTRNYIRHELLPVVSKLNQGGFESTIRNLVLRRSMQEEHERNLQYC